MVVVHIQLPEIVGFQKDCLAADIRPGIGLLAGRPVSTSEGGFAAFEAIQSVLNPNPYRCQLIIVHLPVWFLVWSHTSPAAECIVQIKLNLFEAWTQFLVRIILESRSQISQVLFSLPACPVDLG